MASWREGDHSVGLPTRGSYVSSLRVTALSRPESAASWSTGATRGVVLTPRKIRSAEIQPHKSRRRSDGVVGVPNIAKRTLPMDRPLRHHPEPCAIALKTRRCQTLRAVVSYTRTKRGKTGIPREPVPYIECPLDAAYCTTFEE
jgi:hypothetical protein